jgi:recombination protein RecA
LSLGQGLGLGLLGQGQGKENARNFLIENPHIGNEVEKKIKEKLGIGAVLTDELIDDVLPAPVDF